MKKWTALATVVLALGGCATVPPPPSPWFALGTDPGWTLEVTAEQLNFATDQGRTIVRVANPGERPAGGAVRYTTPQLSVEMSAAPCRDALSERRYTNEVTVWLGERTFNGCGGTIVAPN